MTKAKVFDAEPLKPIIRELFAARLAQGLSQCQLADLIGSGQAVISAWERGVRIPNTEGLYRWAAGLGYDLTVTPRVDEGDEDAGDRVQA